MIKMKNIFFVTFGCVILLGGNSFGQQRPVMKIATNKVDTTRQQTSAGNSDSESQTKEKMTGKSLNAVSKDAPNNSTKANKGTGKK